MAAKKPHAGHGKGTRKAGGKAAGKPAPSSTASRGRISDVRLSPMDRVVRARRIAGRRAKRPRADSWPTIAKAENLSERQARRIYDDYLTWQGVRTGKADKLVEETLDTIEAAIMELDDTIREAAEAGNLNARVGAVRLLLDAVAGRWDVMVASGRIDPDMRRFRHAQESSAIFEAMMRVLKRHDIGQEVLDELTAAAALEPDGLPVIDAIEA